MDGLSKRPLTVTILSVVYLLSGAAGLIYHASDFRSQPATEAMGVAFVRLLAIVAGVYMLRRSNWARWLAMVWIAFHVAISFGDPGKLAVHAVLCGLFAFVLFRPAANRYFHASS